VARPLLNLWWPELAGVAQPLAGEWAASRSLLETLPIPVGYGVELRPRLRPVPCAERPPVSSLTPNAAR
jgi:hypothetical protein